MRKGKQMIRRGVVQRVVGLVAVSLIAGGSTLGQHPEKQVTVILSPGQTVEQRVADEIKAKELRKAAEEKLAEEDAAKLADLSPTALLSRTRILYIESDTSFFDAVQLQNALRKHDEFARWRLAIVDRWDKQNVADTQIEVGRPLFTFTFTYKITDRRTGIMLATGKVTAFDSNVAAPKLASRIIEEIRKARGEPKPKK
jgi:hypothetical protein